MNLPNQNQNQNADANISNNTGARSSSSQPVRAPPAAARAADLAGQAASRITTPQPSGSEPNLGAHIPTNTSLPVHTGSANDQNQRTSLHNSSSGSSHTTPSSDAMDEDPDIGVPDEETPHVSFNSNSTNTSTGPTPTGNPTVTSFRVPFGQTTTTVHPAEPTFYSDPRTCPIFHPNTDSNTNSNSDTNSKSTATTAIRFSKQCPKYSLYCFEYNAKHV
ncbi:unnamed protein product [[Candida] boidinii]|nr:unnamed protein product [[Candida] boidinii]